MKLNRYVDLQKIATGNANKLITTGVTEGYGAKEVVAAVRASFESYEDIGSALSAAGFALEAPAKSKAASPVVVSRFFPASPGAPKANGSAKEERPGAGN